MQCTEAVHTPLRVSISRVSVADTRWKGAHQAGAVVLVGGLGFGVVNKALSVVPSDTVCELHGFYYIFIFFF